MLTPFAHGAELPDMLGALPRRPADGPLSALLLIVAVACGQEAPAWKGTEVGSGGSSAGGGGSGGQPPINPGTSELPAGGAASAAGGVAGAGRVASAGATASAGNVATAGSGAAGTGASGRLPASSDPATFAGEPRCQGFAVCESFETTELGTLPSGFTLAGYGNRQVGVSASRALRGARALELQIPAQGAVTAWLTRKNLGELGATHFGRAFFRVESPAPTEFVHFDLVEGSGPFAGHNNSVRYASTGTGAGTKQSNWSFIYNVQPSGDGAGPEFGSEGDRSAHARVDDWMCLEWSFDASEQVAQYYLDGAAIDYLRIEGERAEIPVFDSLAVGFGKYQNTGAFLVYIDEVALDGERIGCNN
jgi:hypothetical protein